MALISGQIKKAVQQIISSHSPDDNFDVDKTALLSMTKDILCTQISRLTRDLKTNSKVSKDEPQQGITEKLAFSIHKIGCELSCNCFGEGGMKSITLAVFKKLVNYSWEDKLVLGLAAFAVKYEEFRLLWQPPSNNPLAKYVDQLKLFTEISEQETLISRLLRVVICVTQTIIELNDLHTPYISCDKPPCFDYQVSTAVYWVSEALLLVPPKALAL